MRANSLILPSLQIIRRPVQGVKRIEAHPSLPHCERKMLCTGCVKKQRILDISGSSDGTAHVWECGHGQPLATHKKLGSRIMRVHFNHFGNKAGGSLINRNSELLIFF